MALTGVVLVGFVLAHMLGNWQVFLGQQALNDYAYFLKSNPELLWPRRIILLVSLLMHTASGIRWQRATVEHGQSPIAATRASHRGRQRAP